LKFDYFYNYNILVSQVDFTQQNTHLLKPKKIQKYKVVQMLFIYF